MPRDLLLLVISIVLFGVSLWLIGMPISSPWSPCLFMLCFVGMGIGAMLYDTFHFSRPDLENKDSSMAGQE